MGLGGERGVGGGVAGLGQGADLKESPEGSATDGTVVSLVSGGEITVSQLVGK